MQATVDFETDDTTEYLFEEAPTLEWRPLVTEQDERSKEQQKDPVQ